MLEVRYIKTNGQVTGWCGDELQFGKLQPRDKTEMMVTLDEPIPAKSCSSYKYDGIKLSELPIDEPVDEFKDAFAEAKTVDEKVAVIADKLGLI